MEEEPHQKIKRARELIAQESLKNKEKIQLKLIEINALRNKKQEDFVQADVDALESLIKEFHELNRVNWDYRETFDLASIQHHVEKNQIRREMEARRLADPRFVEFEKQVAKTGCKEYNLLQASLLEAFFKRYDEDFTNKNILKPEIRKIMDVLYYETDLFPSDVVERYEFACGLVDEWIMIRYKVNAT